MKKRNKIRKNLKTATLMLAAITTVVWLVLVIIKFVVSDMNLGELFDNILSDILGILPPIILFNFAYEYITKDFMAEEISEEITKTLMSNPSALEAFDKDVKRAFVKSTISSLVGPDKIEAVYGSIEPYLIYQHNIRSSFKYLIEIRNYKPETEKSKAWHTFFDASKYYKIKERFESKKILTGYAPQTKNFKIGFFSNLNELDNELKNQTYIFRENLSISVEDLDELSGMSDSEKIDYLNNSMNLQVFINESKAQIVNCTIDKNGIIAELKTDDYINSTMEVDLNVCFYMPQLKKNCEFLVSITEPTLSPEINLIYDENTMSVRTYPFLNEEADLLTKATQMPGEVSICPKGWIYPVKGVVFIVDQI